MYLTRYKLKSSDENHDEMDITTFQLIMSQVHAVQEFSVLRVMVLIPPDPVWHEDCDQYRREACPTKLSVVTVPV